MNEPFSFDAQLRSILADGPVVAPTSVLDGARDVARGRGQRRARFASLDRQAWPPPRASIACPTAGRTLRVVAILALIVALIAASVAIGSLLHDETNDWVLEDAGSLEVLFAEPIALALPDGGLLVGGWGSGDGRLAEVFDPDSGRSTAVGDRNSALSLQSATPLPDGRVLLIVWQNAEPVGNGRSFGRIFDPADNTLSPPIDMIEDRLQPGVSAMPDGRVLVTGGSTDGESGLVLDTVEVFDPATGAFAPAGRLALGRGGHTQITLPDGRVLINGGSVSVPLLPGATGPAPVDETNLRTTDAILFDPSTGTTTTVASVPGFRVSDPIALPDGRVLIFGPETTRCGQHGNLPSEAFLMDPATETSVQAPSVQHTPTTAVALPDGRAVLAGQWQAIRGGCQAGGEYTIDGWVAVYDPATGATLQTPDPFTGAGGLPFDTDRNYRASVLLADGRVALIDEDLEAAVPNAIDIVDPP